MRGNGDGSYRSDADGDFQQGALSQPNSMLGNFRPNDMIMVTHDTGTVELTSIVFILNDGSDGNPITVRPDDINSA